IAAVWLGAARLRAGGQLRSAALVLLIAGAGILSPIALALLGADYLAPRNLVAAMIPVTALLALAMATPAAGRLGAALAALAVAGFLAITIDVDLSPRLQRGNWRGVARVLSGQRGAPSARASAISTVELAGAPLPYYLPDRKSTRLNSSHGSTAYAVC